MYFVYWSIKTCPNTKTEPLSHIFWLTVYQRPCKIIQRFWFDSFVYWLLTATRCLSLWYLHHRNEIIKPHKVLFIFVSLGSTLSIVATLCYNQQDVLMRITKPLMCCFGDKAHKTRALVNLKRPRGVHIINCSPPLKVWHKLGRFTDFWVPDIMSDLSETFVTRGLLAPKLTKDSTKLWCTAWNKAH